jgi:hypothetical protein
MSALGGIGGRTARRPRSCHDLSHVRQPARAPGRNQRSPSARLVGAHNAQNCIASVLIAAEPLSAQNGGSACVFADRMPVPELMAVGSRAVFRLLFAGRVGRIRLDARLARVWGAGKPELFELCGPVGYRPRHEWTT